MYSIKVLEERKNKLDHAYSDLVKNGEVDSDSKVALRNREQSKDIEKALSILNDSQSDDIMSNIISESERLRLMQYIVNGKSVDEIHDFTTLLIKERERTAYSEKDLRECWNKALEVMVKSEPQDLDTWLSEYER